MSVSCKALYVTYYRLVFVWEKDSEYSALYTCFLLVLSVCALFLTIRFCNFNTLPNCCDLNYFKNKIDYDGFKLLQILSNASWPQSLRSWTQQKCNFFDVIDVVIFLHSSIELQIKWFPGHSSLIGQWPERKCLQPVGWRRRDKRGGQCHLPGAPIVSLLIQYSRASVSHIGCIINFCLMLNYYQIPTSIQSKNMYSMLCSYAISMMLYPLSLVERSQTAQTWWNHQWDTVTWKVRQRHLFDIIFA